MTPCIRRVQIRNFKSIERAVVDLAPLTVLVGPNGVGKSNFVGALVFLQRMVSRGLNEAFRQSSSEVLPRWVEMDFRRGTSVGLKVDLDLAAGIRADYAVEIELGRDFQPTVSRERCRIARDSKPQEVFEVAQGRFVREIAGIRSQLEPDRLALLAASATEEFRPVYDFLVAIRAYSIAPRAVAGLASGVGAGISLEPDGSNAALVLKAVAERSPEDHARITRLLARAVEGITEIGLREDLGSPILTFKKDVGRDQPGTFLGGSMSDGTLRLLGLLLAIYQPNRPSLLVVEEPEATIHPAAAQLVTEILVSAAQDRQILITTHSPDLLDSKELSDEQIRAVSQRDGRTIVAPLAAASRQAIRERLYTPGELLRIGELEQDADWAIETDARLDLFPADSGLV